VSFPEGLLLADKSAWERADHPQVREEWVAALRSGRIAICLPIRYELLYSARDHATFEEMELSLTALREVAITAEVQRAALAGMRDLAALGQHRVPLPDLLIAGAAQAHGMAVLHQDKHFDLLRQVMSFDSHRLLP
jgi:predicted nucleic acid-binding protein